MHTGGAFGSRGLGDQTDFICRIANCSWNATSGRVPLTIEVCLALRSWPQVLEWVWGHSFWSVKRAIRVPMLRTFKASAGLDSYPPPPFFPFILIEIYIHQVIFKIAFHLRHDSVLF